MGNSGWEGGLNNEDAALWDNSSTELYVSFQVTNKWYGETICSSQTDPVGTGI